MTRLLSKLLVISCFLTGCAVNPTSIYTNDTQIASDTNVYNLINIEQTSEKGHFTASVMRMEGMDTIWVFEGEEDTTLDITYTLKVYSGKMKLVLINPDGELSVIAECEDEMDAAVQSTLNLKKGNNRIKVVADENTEFDMNISIPEGEFKELG